MRLARYGIILALTTGIVVACSPSPTSHGGPCEAHAEGQGVKIVIRSSSCDYDRGASAKFDYEITTDATVPTIEVKASQGCGSCNRPSPALASWSGWVISGQSDGGKHQTYCICDTGCCPPNEAASIKPEVNTLRDTIAWSGRVWSGPSDTGQAEGDFFEPGSYEVQVSFAGLAVAKLPIVVRDD